MDDARDDVNGALASGLARALSTSLASLDDAIADVGEAQDGLTARADALARALDAVVALAPVDGAGAVDASRVRALRTRIEGVGRETARLAARVRKMHEGATGMRRADAAALAARSGGELPPKERVFRRLDRGGRRSRTGGRAGVGRVEWKTRAC
ncbi:hypothetical protein BE221DRAFT_189722, partial [Ostreococcus tauri]